MCHTGMRARYAFSSSQHLAIGHADVWLDGDHRRLMVLHNTAKSTYANFGVVQAAEHFHMRSQQHATSSVCLS